VEHLGSLPAKVIFKSRYLSAVIGLRLADDREVVVKVRPDSPRVAACVEVQRRLFQAGYPCPRPLAGAAPFGGDVATAASQRLRSRDRHRAATIEDTGRFLVAYSHARGRELSADELERSWAAGVWTRVGLRRQVSAHDRATGNLTFRG